MLREFDVPIQGRRRKRLGQCHPSHFEIHHRAAAGSGGIPAGLKQAAERVVANPEEGVRIVDCASRSSGLVGRHALHEVNAEAHEIQNL